VNGPLSGTGDTVTYTYDANGFLSTVTDELGHVTQITSVNGRGQPLTILDMNGVETDLAYDAHGRLTSITRVPGANQAVTSLTYDAIGEITQISLPTGGTLSYSYSNARRLTAVQDSAGNRIEYAYDTAGNVTGRTVKDPGSTMLRQRPRPMTS
jgi:YD repeat-containing protein